MYLKNKQDVALNLTSYTGTCTSITVYTDFGWHLLVITTTETFCCWFFFNGARTCDDFGWWGGISVWLNNFFFFSFIIWPLFNIIPILLTIDKVLHKLYIYQILELISTNWILYTRIKLNTNRILNYSSKKIYGLDKMFIKSSEFFSQTVKWTTDVSCPYRLESIFSRIFQHPSIKFSVFRKFCSHVWYHYAPFRIFHWSL